MTYTAQIGRHATSTHSQHGVIYVTYHQTNVVAWDKDASTVTLNTGGWYTPTTKKRMNQASQQFGLGFHVFQKDFQWYVTTPNGEMALFNGGGTAVFAV